MDHLTIVNRSAVPFVLRRIVPPFGGTALDLETTEAPGTVPGRRNAGVPGTDDSAPERQDPDLPLENNRPFVLAATASRSGSRISRFPWTCSPRGSSPAPSPSRARAMRT